MRNLIDATYEKNSATLSGGIAMHSDTVPIEQLIEIGSVLINGEEHT